MATTRKDVRLHTPGPEEWLVLGQAADWAEVAVVVDVYLDQAGYPPDWHLDATRSVEAADHYATELTNDAAEALERQGEGA